MGIARPTMALAESVVVGGPATPGIGREAVVLAQSLECNSHLRLLLVMY